MPHKVANKMFIKENIDYDLNYEHTTHKMNTVPYQGTIWSKSDLPKNYHCVETNLQKMYGRLQETSQAPLVAVLGIVQLGDWMKVKTQNWQLIDYSFNEEFGIL